jgi:hypothetical protein
MTEEFENILTLLKSNKAEDVKSTFTIAKTCGHESIVLFGFDK